MPPPPPEASGASSEDPPASGDGPAPRTKVFICYSHNDLVYLNKLLAFLYPIERAGLTEVWVDTQIKSGKKWREEIQKALNATKVAILLVSIDFINSAFITDVELPQLLEAAQRDGVYIVPSIVRPCERRFSRLPDLNQFRTENDPKMPLAKMKPWQREEFWDRLAGRIEDLLSGSAP